MTKQMCESLIARFTGLYHELASEKKELDSVYWKIRSKNPKIKEQDILYSEYEDIKEVIEKIHVSLLPFLEELNLFKEDNQLTEIGKYMSYTYSYLKETKSKNLSPISLSDSIKILLDQISFSISVWNLKKIFLICAQESDYRNTLFSCADNADKIYPLLKNCL